MSETLLDGLTNDEKLRIAALDFTQNVALTGYPSEDYVNLMWKVYGFLSDRDIIDDPGGEEEPVKEPAKILALVHKEKE